MRPFFSVTPSKIYTHRNAMILIVAGFTLSILAIGLLVGRVSAQPLNPAALQQSGTDGQGLFQTKCAACHSIGKGKLVGPDLKDVTKRRSLQWVKSFIADPNKMFDTDPTAKDLLQQYQIKMPSLGLTPDEVDALVNYLDHPEGGLPAAVQPQGQKLVPDAARGARLFNGETALAKNGPNCIACHTVSGVGILGGGGLGPDLTHVIQRYGEPGLTAALQTISFPTMIGPFKNRGLTPAEQADLIAFFKQADQQPAVANIAAGTLSQQALVILGISLGGSLALFGLMLIYWPRQRESLSSRLRNSRKGGTRQTFGKN